MVPRKFSSLGCNKLKDFFIGGKKMKELLKEMAPKYDPKEVEQGKYQYWLDHGFFTSGDLTKKPYSIVIPPPNVTGKLHLGHAWDTALQDMIARYKRMQGFDVLWLPGMDHAGIATQAKIDAKLKNQGISRYDIGREAFLKVAWEWKAEYAKTIRAQWAALGLSLDYTKERFTLDEGMNNAVYTVFKTLYDEGLIYRGEKIINWDVEAKTALSNIEVEYKDIECAFYHFIYPFVDGDGGLEIATTRPETMFGDTAIMVHPKDERYQKYIGKKVYIPGTKREIPVISDEYVEMDFGTGVVKVTPAHDPNDFEVGLRHNLARPLCMNDDGTMNEMAGEYNGMDRFECRKAVVKKLTELGLCPKIEKMIHSVGHSERTGVIVEPRLSKQWFVKMAPLAKDVLEMQQDPNKRINFIPERFNQTFSTWIENTQDWCISRQLWWGHQIPAWYKGEDVVISKECPGEGFIHDEDVLDTWFSSALWTFATFGWPEKTKLLERYTPTNCLVTGYDIIFFWVARMAFQTRHFMGERPFEVCMIHGLIRDEQGRKMSKSLGNGIDPFDVVEKYGCDALRYFLTTNSTPGQDLRYSDEKVASSWNYINKLWNISRYIGMQLKNYNYQDEPIDYKLLSPIDKWLMNKLDVVIENANTYFDKYDFGEASKGIYNFVWDDFASWYIELSKVTLNSGQNVINTCAILKDVLIKIVKLLHPYMPFVTEEIYQHFCDGSITVSSWPLPYQLNDNHSDDLVNKMLDIITSIRNMRTTNNVAPSKKLTMIIDTNASVSAFLKEMNPYLEKFANYESLTFSNNYSTENANIIVLDNVKIIIPLKELIDYEKELKRLNSERDRLTSEVERSNKMLNNPSFISKAPAEKVNLEKEKLSKYEEQLKEVSNTLEQLKKMYE